jgi:hypothetical protein
MKLARLTALVLFAFLLMASTALAEDAENPVPSFAESEAQFTQELEWEEAGEEVCIETEVESSSEEEDEGLCEELEERGAESSEAEECPLRSTRAHGSTAHDRLKITVGYTTYRPAAATIQIGSGANKLGTFKRHLGRSGVLRFTEKGSTKHGKRVVVHVSVPSAQRYCADEAAVLFK